MPFLSESEAIGCKNEYPPKFLRSKNLGGRSIYQMLVSLARYIGVSPAEVDACALPLVGGLAQFLWP